jgi:hypothetical protein
MSVKITSTVLKLEYILETGFLPVRSSKARQTALPMSSNISIV